MSVRSATMTQSQPFPSFETAMNLDEKAQRASLALALRRKLDNLPPLVFSPTRQMTHRRWPSDLSANSSTHSASSIFSAAETINDTEGTEPFSASRSRSNTFWKQPLSFSETKEGYIPHKPFIKIVLGTASLGSELSPIAKINTPAAASAFISTFRARGYSDIDTARAYPVG